MIVWQVPAQQECGPQTAIRGSLMVHLIVLKGTHTLSMNVFNKNSEMEIWPLLRGLWGEGLGVYGRKNQLDKNKNESILHPLLLKMHLLYI